MRSFGIAAQLILMNGPFVAPAVVVQRVGDELLARAVFALDQDVGLGIGHRGHQIEQLAHLAAAPDDVVELVAVAELPLERDVLRFQIHALERARQHREDAVGIDGLLEEVRRAGLDRLDRARDAALPADHQHFRARLQRLEPADEICPVGVGQHEVHQRGIRQPGREGFRRLGAAVLRPSCRSPRSPLRPTATQPCPAHRQRRARAVSCSMPCISRETVEAVPTRVGPRYWTVACRRCGFIHRGHVMSVL